MSILPTLWIIWKTTSSESSHESLRSVNCLSIRHRFGNLWCDLYCLPPNTEQIVFLRLRLEGIISIALQWSSQTCSVTWWGLSHYRRYKLHLWDICHERHAGSIALLHFLQHLLKHVDYTWGVSPLTVGGFVPQLVQRHAHDSHFIIHVLRLLPLSVQAIQN